MHCRKLFKPVIVVLLTLGALFQAFGAAKVSGELKQWHRVTLDVEGPASSETGTPNPFLDCRLQVEFTGPAGQKYLVPGYFAADGNAGESGAAEGTVWRAHISPDQAGKWTYKISFRSGPKVAISDSPTEGTAVTGDGEAGEFTIAPTDKGGRDFRGKGRLKYVGAHHLQFAGTKEYFLKAGADSPENMLGYADFDATNKSKTWEPHVKDWKEGDPTWKGGKGKGLIGALNYLAGKGMNVFSFLTFNVGGDGKDVWMYTTSSERLRFDCSKLDQWGIVFSHGEKMGLYLHFKLQETENDGALDGGDMGDQRKIYLRELIARFSHHMALNWNLGEENRQSSAQQKAMAEYLHTHDPYQHHIVLHTYPGEQVQRYTPLLGNASKLTGVSLQVGPSGVYSMTKEWVGKSAAAGKKWVVANDEQGSANVGVSADAGYSGSKGSHADNRTTIRHQVLWGNIMAGGGGVEYYFGYQTGETDLTLQDFRSRDTKWDDARHALEFFSKNNVPFWEMSSSSASSVGWTLAKAGEHYVVYLPTGGNPTLDLAGATGAFTARWFDPRTGAEAADKKSTVAGGAKVALGESPAGGDWVVYVRKDGITSLNGPAGLRAGRKAASGPSVQADGRQVKNPGLQKVPAFRIP